MKKPIIDTVKELLFAQRLGILATVNDDSPYTSIVGFAAEPDMKSIYFGTPRATLKLRNIQSNPAVSLLIDNRQNLGSDFSIAAALTCVGGAKILSGEETDRARDLLSERHPELRDFFASPTCALVKISICKFSLVRNFQEVTEFFPGKDL
ncbi:MAG: hypothetical protein CVV42_15090 [Candidatus Riflebacteria bacterium HGW-Riflebacteria-2]|nr:MAG: hypothetical protein CVV42_15090 [Candidatus Riflebacteria bacterium HGW-Riflebacteria-2]